MPMNLPKLKMISSTVKTPKISMPNLKFVSKPNVGSMKPPRVGSKLKIKYK